MPHAALNTPASAEPKVLSTEADPFDSPDETERRAWVRYPCSMETACDVSTSIHADDKATQDHWRATVRNLSRKGLGLLLSRRFEPKTLLQVRLESRNRTFTRTVQVRVRHVAKAPGSRWFIGGAFVGELSKDDLRRLL